MTADRFRAPSAAQKNAEDERLITERLRVTAWSALLPQRDPRDSLSSPLAAPRRTALAARHEAAPQTVRAAA